MKIRPIAIASLALLTALPATSALAAQKAGDRSFSISGTGSSDKDFDTNTFGTTGEIGWYLNDSLELGIRQTLNVISLDDEDDIWSGATRGFADWHFGQGTVVPYLGANLGGIYGEETDDTGAGGIEGGLKWYVKDQTYIGFQVEYQWLFEDTEDIDNRFNDGRYFYTLGVGFNF
jgi:hypothetical protein